MTWWSRFLQIRRRQDWAWDESQIRPTLSLIGSLRPGWYLMTVLLHAEQRHCHGRFLTLQDRSLISGRLRRRLVRVSRRHRNQPIRFQLLGLNASPELEILDLVPQLPCRARRLIRRKLLRLHPAYGRGLIKSRPFSQQWRDYNRLLARRSFSLVGYDDWLERVEAPRIERQLASPYALPASPEAQSADPAGRIPSFAFWIWGDRGSQGRVEKSAQSIEQQWPGSYNLLPTDASLKAGDPNQWVLLLEVGDRLPPQTLQRFSEVLATHPEACILYADEDHISASGRRHRPHFKPAWNPELLYADPDYSHSWLIRSDVCLATCESLEQAGAPLTLLSLILEATATCLPDQIVHVPDILYHRLDRLNDDRGDSSTVATVTSFLQRHGEAATVSLRAGGGHRLHWPLPAETPLVSLIIPTRDRGDLLKQCLNSIAEHGYQGLQTEVLIIDNNSTDPDTLSYLAQLNQSLDVRVLSCPGPFNYASLNNHAAAFANGEVLLFLNNDVEALHSGWLEALVSEALRPQIGAVGAKLLFDDQTIQHAGVVLGIGGIAGHAHKYLPADDPGYQLRLQLTHAVSAVTAAVLAVRKSVFESVGGFDADLFAVNYNDVDLCLRLQLAGYRNLYCADAMLMHHESRSRGEPTNQHDYDLWQKERSNMIQRWGNYLLTDPQYNPHLSLHEENFSLWLDAVDSMARTGVVPTPQDLRLGTLKRDAVAYA